MGGNEGGVSKNFLPGPCLFCMNKGSVCSKNQLETKKAKNPFFPTRSGSESSQRCQKFL